MNVVVLIAAIAFVAVSSTRFNLHPFLALLIAAFGFGLFSGMPLDTVVGAINAGFGETVGYIGIVIIAGSIIGAFLQHSGGALRIAEWVLGFAGRKRVPATLGVVGYIVSIPVFCDSGFLLLSPVARALARRAGVALAAAMVALSLGLYSTHCLVPPTPGPVAAAAILNADLGLVIAWGLALSVVTTVAGVAFAILYAARIRIEPANPATDNLADSHRARGVDEPAEVDRAGGGPGIVKSLVPILLPIALIILRSVSQLPDRPFGDGALSSAIAFLGQPAVALLIGACFAFLLPRRFDREMLSEKGWVGEAIRAAAIIILITAAGGAFGRVLAASGVGEQIGRALSDTSLGLLIPFLIAAVIKTVQGSSTVAMITTAGIIAPLLGSLGLESEGARALAAIAVGAGAMIVSHANDSYFWVVTQFSGMSIQQGYRLQTLGTLVQGLAAAPALLLFDAVLL